MVSALQKAGAFFSILDFLRYLFGIGPIGPQTNLMAEDKVICKCFSLGLLACSEMVLVLALNPKLNIIKLYIK